MRKRGLKKLWRNPERLKAYGLRRSRGSARLRRGRRSILRDSPNCRNWDSVPFEKQMELLERALQRLENR